MEQLTIKKLLALKSGDWVMHKDEKWFLKEYQFIGALKRKDYEITTFFFYSDKFGYESVYIYDFEEQQPDLEIKTLLLGKRDEEKLKGG